MTALKRKKPTVRIKRQSCGGSISKRPVPAGPVAEALERRVRSARTKVTWTNADEAEVQRQIAADPEDAEITDEEAGQRMTFAQALPALADKLKRSRGRPAVTNPKRPVSLRLSPEVIEAYKATGKGWQTRIEDVLRKAVGL